MQLFFVLISPRISLVMSGTESEALKPSTTVVEAEPQAVERVGEQGVIHQGEQLL